MSNDDAPRTVADEHGCNPPCQHDAIARAVNTRARTDDLVAAALNWRERMDSPGALMRLMHAVDDYSRGDADD